MTARARLLPGGVGCAVSLLVLSGCANSDNGGADAGANGRIGVVASTDVWGSVVSAVGGNDVQVRSLINSPSQDPHGYESDAVDALEIGRAKLVISNGGGYDAFFAKAVSASGNNPSNVVAFDLSGKGGKGGAEPNEHVFYDLPTVAKVADRVAADLGGIDKKHRNTFTANARGFQHGIERLRTRAAKIGTTHPGLRAVCTESVADYLLRTAGIQVATPKEFAEAVEHDIDVPAEALARTMSLISGRKVDILVNNAQAETPTTSQLKAVAGRAGVPVVDVTETQPAGTAGYLSWMGKTVERLTAAANRQR
jgi:zinc/manganese transport system substrate-binding protein